MTEPRIFISSVTSELGSYRDELARLLRKRQCTVKVQADFNPTSEEYLLPMLHDYIQTCHVVICLVGERYGHEPVGPEATDFAFTYGIVEGSSATPRYSYTQWEYIFARKMNKAVFVFLPTPDLQRDPLHLENPEESILAALQAAFIDGEIRGRSKTRTPFDSLEKLKEEIQSIDFHRLALAEHHEVELKTESPYVGLRHFRESERGQFYGRGKLISELLIASEQSPLLLVLGSSGSGKSSVIRAGVIPALRRKHRGKEKIVVFNPDVDPFEGLYGGLLRAEFSQEDARIARTPSPNIILECFSSLRKPGEAWLIFIDQFEEIFTRTPKNEEAKACLKQFIAALVSTATHPDPGLRVILAMRDDFFSNLEGHKALCEITDENFERVTSLTDRELRDVIHSPAAAHGVSFEPGLIDCILRDVQDPRGRLPLPLLQYTLDVLWRADDVSDRMLNQSTYEQIGGVKGALQKKVTDYYGALGAEHQQSVRRILLRLVDIGEKEVPVSRAARKSELDTKRDGEVFEQLLTHEKLLIAKEGSDGARGDSTVELAHEALISGWEEYHKWVAESREAITLRNAINHDATSWKQLHKSNNPSERKRAIAELWSGSRMERALELQATDGFDQLGGLDDMESEFLSESGNQRKREIIRLRRRNLILSVLSVIAIAGGAFALVKQSEASKAGKLAQEKGDEAINQRDEARYNEGLGWLLRAQVAEERKNQYPDTLLYAAQAIGFEGMGRPADAPESLLRYIRKDRNQEAFQIARNWISDRPAYLPIWSSEAYPSPATGLKINADGSQLALASADGSIRFWYLREETMHEIREPNEQLASFAFYPTGIRMVVINGTTSVAISEDGDTIATAGKDGSIRLRRLGKVSVIETGMPNPASAITFSTENSLGAAVFPSGIRVFFPNYNALANAWTEHQQKSSAVDISPDGKRIAAGTPDGEIVIYDAASAITTGRCAGEQRHGGQIMDIAYRPDGRQLASASMDGTIRLWDTNGNIPTVIATLRGHSGGVSNLAWFPCGRMLATAGADGSARIWNTSGATMTSPDLHSYLSRSWYRFDKESKVISWVNGEGIINVPHDSLLGLHLANGDPMPILVAASAWNGLAEGADLPPELLTAADNAAKANQWRTLDLRLKQMRRLKVSFDTVDKFTRMQESIATPEKPYSNFEGMDFIWCAPGSFTIGSPLSENQLGRQRIETQHEVSHTSGFWLAKTELTQEQWMSVMGAGNNPSNFTISGLNHPAENVSWSDAMEFCRRLTDRERARGALPPEWEYTLPTEAQWEYACRSGSETAYSFGNNPANLDKYGHHKRSEQGNVSIHFTIPVGDLKQNEWGFHDMYGNVREWCRDSLDVTSPGFGNVRGSDPLGKDGNIKAIRGGSFENTASDCRSASRAGAPPNVRSGSLGFRPALVISNP